MHVSFGEKKNKTKFAVTAPLSFVTQLYKVSMSWDIFFQIIDFMSDTLIYISKQNQYFVKVGKQGVGSIKCMY